MSYHIVLYSLKWIKCSVLRPPGRSDFEKIPDESDFFSRSRDDKFFCVERNKNEWYNTMRNGK